MDFHLSTFLSKKVIQWIRFICSSLAFTFIKTMEQTFSRNFLDPCILDYLLTHVIQIGYKWQINSSSSWVLWRLVFPMASIEYPGTRVIDQFFKYSNTRVIRTSIEYYKLKPKMAIFNIFSNILGIFILIFNDKKLICTFERLFGA